MGLEGVEIASKRIQKSTGILDDVVQGIGGDRQTAREFLGRAEGAGTRLDWELRLCEIMWAEPDGDAVMELNRQFLTSEREAVLLGDLAQTDPVTGASNQLPAGSVVTIDPEDVLPRLRARATGTSRRLAKALQQQNFMLVMQTAFGAAASNPAMLAQLNLFGWVKQLAAINEVGPEVNDLIVQDPQRYAAQLALMMQGAAGPGAQGPGGEAVPGGGPPPIEQGAPSEIQGPEDLTSLQGTIGGGLQQ